MSEMNNYLADQVYQRAMKDAIDCDGCGQPECDDCHMLMSYRVPKDCKCSLCVVQQEEEEQEEQMEKQQCEICGRNGLYTDATHERMVEGEYSKIFSRTPVCACCAEMLDKEGTVFVECAECGHELPYNKQNLEEHHASWCESTKL